MVLEHDPCGCRDIRISKAAYDAYERDSRRTMSSIIARWTHVSSTAATSASIVLAEAPMPAQQANGALHHPPPGQYLEPDRRGRRLLLLSHPDPALRLAHDRHGPARRPGHPLSERPLVGRVDQERPLAATPLLAAVVAARARFRGLRALTVEDGGTGLRLPSRPDPDLPTQGVQEPFPGPIALPAAQVGLGSLPVRPGPLIMPLSVMRRHAACHEARKTHYKHEHIAGAPAAQQPF